MNNEQINNKKVFDKNSYQREWQKNNKDKRKLICQRYYQKNKKKVLEQTKKYKTTEKYKKQQKEYFNSFDYKNKKKKWWSNNKEKRKKYSSEYYQKNKEKIISKRREKRKNDIDFKIKDRLRCRFLKAIKAKNTIKNNSVLNLIGCNLDEFKIHIKSKFKQGMTWDNHGYKGWHFDHIKPCASFDLKNLEQQKLCFHYSNIQPLWWWENLSKGDTILSEE
jgi:hypothetical protein